MRKAIMLVLATVLFSACATVQRANTSSVPEYAKAEFKALQNKYPTFALPDDVILDFFAETRDFRTFQYHAYKVRNGTANECAIVYYFPNDKEDIFRFTTACTRAFVVSKIK